MSAANTGQTPLMPRSVDLPANVKKLLAKHIASYKKPVDAAIEIGLDRNTMQRINKEGSGAGKNIEKIVNFFKNKKQSAQK
jgi:hypothetical protein